MFLTLSDKYHAKSSCKDTTKSAHTQDFCKNNRSSLRNQTNETESRENRVETISRSYRRHIEGNTRFISIFLLIRKSKDEKYGNSFKFEKSYKNICVCKKNVVILHDFFRVLGVEKNEA